MESLTTKAGELQLGIRPARACSRAGNLSFNWSLVLASPEGLEYVVVHELWHLREPNHAKAFWRLLDAARPGWPEQACWLRENGHELHAYEPALTLSV